ncbi:VWA domain-containing protein [Metabacillus fastidiosus]|uniref:VWA domain-containing protein n=1 Tax=Metabacillus fastidiosus TaxID=1458 RepID=A0ABU6P2U6_9BACI|nr:VWA domain-containing protein [Metabacillus fastidiosus]MED4403671.1 VWA domain-containing protein [Metabacillus fastidiosus]MED4452462.1 VWA domain-containing protein [Metabacillus fastidiosus]MED4463603.1 VWA domain-containing protein [Metabacillus fastidiosus]
MRTVKQVLFIALIVLLSAILFACGSNETGNDQKPGNENKNKLKADEKAEDEEEKLPFASTAEEILKEKPGQYSGNKYNKAIIHRTLDEENFLEKDSFEIYNTLLTYIREGENYKQHYDFFEEFNPSIETPVSEMPGGMKLEENGEVGLNTNIAILLDASGSMAQKIGGKTKMELAKEAINEFVATMPEEANVMLRVYGHKGSNDDGDKELSCGATEVMYDLKPYNETEFRSSLESFEPKGWTPIAKAIQETKTDFEKGNEGSNIIYVVSDGIETCDGDPVQAAKELHDSNIKAVINIIGFDVDSDGQKQLFDVAEAGGGQYKTVSNAADFKKLWESERRRLFNEWWNWSNSNWSKVWNEQTKKSNEIYKEKSKFNSLIYDEKSRLNEAAYYLQQKEQMSYETRQEVDSLIKQRYDILDTYLSDKSDELRKTLEEESAELKEAIKTKGEEMKKKYGD